MAKRQLLQTLSQVGEPLELADRWQDAEETGRAVLTLPAGWHRIVWKYLRPHLLLESSFVSDITLLA